MVQRAPAGADRAAVRSDAGSVRLDAPLGRGGMGVIHRALDAYLQRTGALPVLRAGALGPAPSGVAGSSASGRAVQRMALRMG